MLKTFTLNKREETTISDTEGTITFFITDENSVERTITGTTFLKDGIAQGVSSKNKRELPLIEALFRLEPEESAEVDFEFYNQAFDRDSNKTVNQIAYETVMQMKKEKSLLYRIGQFFKSSQQPATSSSKSAS